MISRIGQWNLANSAGEPKQTLDCIDFIPETATLVNNWWSLWIFYQQQEHFKL